MIYLDNAATTELCEEAREAMRPYLEEDYGNPSSIYLFAQRAKRAVEESRRKLSELMGVSPTELYFTGGGTESDNWALISGIESTGKSHIISSKIEHHAVLRSCAYLEKRGFSVSYLDVDKRGRVDPAAVLEAIRDETGLISIMSANNEIGTIEPISEIAEIAGEKGILFHTDAVQAFGQLPLPLGKSRIDLLSASAHKIRGPKGVGLLYMRRGVKLPPYLHGGEQERGRRAGTENVAAIAGFAAAAERAFRTMKERGEKERRMRDYLIRRLTTEIPDCYLNGDPEERLPNNVNVCIRGVEAEPLLLLLDQRGIAASAGSACASGSLDPSHVILALGASREDAYGSLRLSLDERLSREDADRVVSEIKSIADYLRRE